MGSGGVLKLKVFDQASLPEKLNAAVESESELEKEAQANKVEVVKAESDWYLKPILTLTALMIFCGVLAAGYDQLKGWLDRPVTEVRLLGETTYLNKQALAEKLAAGISKPLFETDLSPLHQLVVEEPWIRNARVSKHWPPALEVTIDEQIPVARWGEKGLLNHQGDIFWPNQGDSYPELPVLNGPATETQNLMARYQELSLLFQSASVKMSKLSMEARGAWELTLDNGVEVVLGREDLKDRLQRFLHLYKKRLADQAGRIERVDIRYTNGVAVKWRDEPPVDETTGVKAG